MENSRITSFFVLSGHTSPTVTPDLCHLTSVRGIIPPGTGDFTGLMFISGQNPKRFSDRPDRSTNSLYPLSDRPACRAFQDLKTDSGHP